jgi:monoamine oxidase
MGLTRREFLMRVGQAGGYSAAFLAMQGLGLMPARAAELVTRDSLGAAPGSGKGVKVVILGAGIAGMVAAYEMRQLGYEVTIIEARERPGGRNWTVRKGDVVKFIDGTTQTCQFDPGNYQNFGPGRLPSIHPNILAYCKKLGVELEVEVNTTRSSFLQNDNANDGKPVVLRQAVNDTRGHVSELLAKCVNAGALDAELTGTDKDRMLAMLRGYGPLDRAGKYVGSDRAGYAVTPGAGDDTGVLSKPIDLHTMLDEHFWGNMLFEEIFDMQATMFQPVGGMDKIAYAFAKSLGKTIEYSAPVTEIRKTAKGVRIGYKQHGVAKTIEGDYCICTMPLTVLKHTANDFSAPFKEAIELSQYAEAYKVAWESRRFWEQDYNIYGGLEFVNVGCNPVWFPSAKIFSERGVLVSGYTNEKGTPFGSLTIPQKFDESRRTIERLHPGHGKELEKPIYVGWGKIPYNEGSWALWPGGDHDPGYETLIQPDGPIYFAGCHLSHIVAWQEGAIVSSLRVVKMIGERTKAARLATTSSTVSA